MTWGFGVGVCGTSPTHKGTTPARPTPHPDQTVFYENQTGGGDRDGRTGKGERNRSFQSQILYLLGRCNLIMRLEKTFDKDRKKMSSPMGGDSSWAKPWGEPGYGGMQD
ncbi:MAG: hypothetical protein D6698_02765 [Gammaproteobacteria bacterium]|nr:MAG: hypothetical protein D6698_02765 [Gammaproteobacteria bacterium]